MTGGDRRVRRGRSATAKKAAAVAVTGANGELGRRVLAHLATADEPVRLVGVDTARGDLPGVTWRLADVRDPALPARLSGAQTVVHLATDRSMEVRSAAERRAVNVRGTEMLLAAAAAAGVERVVLLTSAMVYGAEPGNPVPLPEDAPVAAECDAGMVGDWVEMERVAEAACRQHPSLRVTVVRPASVVGAIADVILPRLFEAPRLLAFRGIETHWQFCHVDDLVSALVWAALGRVEGTVTVGSEGWLGQAEVERISGLRSLVVPPAMAFATVERLQRAGVLPAPASELHYLAHPWVVGSQRLRSAGWTPGWDNAAALRDHLETIGGRGVLARVDRRDATRAAAGATVALVGTLAIAT